ncbi:MAG: helix-turn-helix transcriptional regulator [Thermodesulfobacteriota bacterium]|nr:helix-turn-helix transcriptional regulator [Thermodesulfobacteriota bacterium]
MTENFSHMKKLFSTKEVAQFLDVNEKMVYSLVSEKGLPATKITGKWLFPRHLVEQWIETNTINYPKPSTLLPPYHGLLILTGSNDLLLDKTISLFNSNYNDQVAVFGNLGGMGGLRALRQNLCHIATSHLLQENENEYNFEFATQELEKMPAVINFCKREMGILIRKGNPKNIIGVADLAHPNIRIVNRPLGTGARLFLDIELKKAGISGDQIEGYYTEVQQHLDVGLEILSGRSDAGPGIGAVAYILGLEFISLRWECYDLLITKERFFDHGVQLFLGILHEKAFHEIAESFKGYDISLSGKMVFP